MNQIHVDGYPTKAFDLKTSRRLTANPQERVSRIELTITRDLLFLFQVDEAEHTVTYEDPLAFKRKVSIKFRVFNLTDDKDKQQIKITGTIFGFEYHPAAYEQTPAQELHEVPDEENEFQLVPPGPTAPRTRRYKLTR